MCNQPARASGVTFTVNGEHVCLPDGADLSQSLAEAIRTHTRYTVLLVTLKPNTMCAPGTREYSCVHVCTYNFTHTIGACDGLASQRTLFFQYSAVSCDHSRCALTRV